MCYFSVSSFYGCTNHLFSFLFMWIFPVGEYNFTFILWISSLISKSLAFILYSTFPRRTITDGRCYSNEALLLFTLLHKARVDNILLRIKEKYPTWVVVRRARVLILDNRFGLSDIMGVKFHSLFVWQPNPSSLSNPPSWPLPSYQKLAPA